ncbi:MAG: DNA polymerase sliding clamp [Halobacteriota archaeon]
MFTAIVGAETLGGTLDSVSVLVDECKVRLNEEGLAVRAVDPANVGMVDLTLDASAFESYEADDELIGVDLGRLDDLAGMADSGQLIDLELDEEVHKLRLRIDGLRATMGLINPESIREEPDIPDLDLPATIVLEGRDLNRAITAADMVSDHVEFGVDEENGLFYVDARGDTDDIRLELAPEELIEFEPGPASSLFSLDYLRDINRAIPTDTEVQIRLGEEYPVKFTFPYAEGRGQVTYMLAPRIQSD